jgi:hypothetical protein
MQPETGRWAKNDRRAMLFGMAWFGDLLRPAASGPTWAPFFTASQHAIFDTLVRSELVGRGLVAQIEEGVVVATSGDENRRYGLLNLAQACARVPPERWPEVVRGHFERVFAADDESAELAAKVDDFAAVRDQLRVRLFPPDVEGEGRVIWPVAEGIVAALVFDLPSAIRTVSQDEIAPWGRSLEELRAIALANLALEREPARERFDAQGVPLEAIHGESFFTASWALGLEEANDRARHPHGTILAVPTRHGVLHHPVVDLGVIAAVNALALIADGMFKEGPGGISPSIYWVRGGRWSRIATEIEGGRLSVTPPEDFVELLEALSKPS